MTLQGDLSRAFLEKLEKAFPLERAIYKENESLADVAFKAGQQELIAWIKSHARISSHS